MTLVIVPLLFPSAGPMLGVARGLGTRRAAALLLRAVDVLRAEVVLRAVPLPERAALARLPDAGFARDVPVEARDVRAVVLEPPLREAGLLAIRSFPSSCEFLFRKRLPGPRAVQSA
jgi:hypothetical protein